MFFEPISNKIKADQLTSEYGFGGAINHADDQVGRQKEGGVDQTFWKEVLAELVSRA
tara:strand:- start:30 stop:200 length:171 start_codon:yes stop_codon:yes gene_type:complete